MNEASLSLLDLLLKGSAMLCLGFGARFWLGRSSAAQRSLAWLAIFAVLLVLPLGLMMRPLWSLPVRVRIDAPAMPALALKVESAAAFEAGSIIALTPPAQPWSMSEWLLPLYLVGGMVVLSFRGIGTLQLARIQRRAMAADERLRDVLKQCSSRKIRLLVSDDVAVPMIWGTLRPVIVFPTASAVWSEPEMKSVMQHELAHACHRDAARRWLGTAVCALWWPLPLGWLASRAWGLEQERACDDAVLRGSADPARYAAQLLATARQWRCHRFQTAAALVMAMPSGLETRLRSVLGHAVNRAPLGWSAIVTTDMVGLIAALLGLGSRAQALVRGAPEQIYIQTKFIVIDPAMENTFGLPADGAVTLSEAEMQQLHQKLYQKKGVDILSAPSVTTKSGRADRVEVVREFIYVTALGEDGVTPVAFDMKPIGIFGMLPPNLTTAIR